MKDPNRQKVFYQFTCNQNTTRSYYCLYIVGYQTHLLSGSTMFGGVPLRLQTTRAVIAVNGSAAPQPPNRLRTAETNQHTPVYGNTCREQLAKIKPIVHWHLISDLCFVIYKLLTLARTWGGVDVTPQVGFVPCTPCFWSWRSDFCYSCTLNLL